MCRTLSKKRAECREISLLNLSRIGNGRCEVQDCKSKFKALIAVFHCHILRSLHRKEDMSEDMCGLRKSLPCQFSFSSRHREIVGTYYWLLCGCFGVLFDELHTFHAHFNLQSRQFLDCFSFGICKVRDTAARKLKRVQMILNEWCLGTALAWLGLNLETNQQTVCYKGYPNCHFPSSPKHELPLISDEYYPF